MGKKNKIGKNRRDKFYSLAKESGYRSRASFKLMQLNQTYNFFSDARICIDLCAAPGGWLQVAAKNMPITSRIVGVDLCPIKPLKNVHTFCADITMEKCRHDLRKYLGHHSADIVLHDGAPNMGTSWLLDSYNQNVLALKSLKIAVEFLRVNGWFVTKLFRAKDYFSFCWVAQQFFKQIHTTKPSASRLESSEIFLVCQGFLNLDSYDPRFFDEKFVYKEVQLDKPLKLTVNALFPKVTCRKPRNREGYPDNVTNLFKRISAKEFIESDNYVDLISDAYEIEIDDDRIRNSTATSAEILECAKDVKVLGKREIKNLLKWRQKIRAEFHDLQSKLQQEDTMNVEGDSGNNLVDIVNSDEEIDQILADAQHSDRSILRRKRKKMQKQNQKHRTRLALKMINPGDEFDIQNEQAFSLESARDLKNVLTKQNTFERFTELSKNNSKNNVSDGNVDDWFKRASVDIGADNLVDDMEELVIKEAVGNLDSDNDLEKDLIIKEKRKKRKNNVNTKLESLSAEELALAHVMKQSSKDREEIIDKSYNRFTGYGDTDDLPGWFVEDEEKHCRRPPEAPKELVEEYRGRMKGINARPIKKVVEAKQRKRNRQTKTVEKMMKHVELIPDDIEPAERQKRIEEIYRNAKGARKPKKSVALVVAGKGSIPRKGRYKFVDRRMKKDKRGEARARLKRQRKSR
ncbi:hypothetical protein GJ496_000543 [Pomphorhynchus laevis]|nr:hypothetical protein GJ496_000543 [Pomphorhynchus laevis]